MKSQQRETTISRHPKYLRPPGKITGITLQRLSVPVIRSILRHEIGIKLQLAAERENIISHMLVFTELLQECSASMVYPGCRYIVPVHAVTGKDLIDIPELPQQSGCLKKPDVMIGTELRNLQKDRQKTPFHGRVVAGKGENQVQQRKKTSSPIDFLYFPMESGNAGQHCLSQGIELGINHFAVAENHLTITVFFKDLGQRLDLFRQPDIILIAEEDKIPFRLPCQMNEILLESQSLRIPDIAKFSGELTTNRFDRTKHGIVIGIVSDQDLVRHAGLHKQTFQLFSNIFFTAIRGKNNGNLKLSTGV